VATIYKRGDGKRWYVSYFDHTGTRRTVSARTSEYEAAKRIAAKLEAEAALRRERVIDPREESIAEQLSRPIGEHLADFRAKIRAAGRTDRHATDTISKCRKIVKACDIQTAGDITADAVNRYAADLRSAGRSARTIQSYLTASKSLTAWLTKTGKLPSDPLVTISKPNPESDRRLERRMLLHEEWAWLRSVTETEGVIRFGMEAGERVLLYATAIQTGLRSNELRSLKRGNIHAGDRQPYITIRAGETKNRTAARQYVSHDRPAGADPNEGTDRPAVPHAAHDRRGSHAPRRSGRRPEGVDRRREG